MACGGYDFEIAGDTIKEYECPICLLLIRDASMLPCTHTLCQTCLQKWENEDPQNTYFLFLFANQELEIFCLIRAHRTQKGNSMYRR